MNKKLTLCLLLISLSFLAGCWDINEIEKTQFPAYITIDPDPKPGFYKYSLQFPVLREEAPKEVNDISTIDTSLQGALNGLQARTMGWISLGMMRIAIFNKQAAQQGIAPHIDALWRNPLVPGTLNLAITKQPAAEIKKLEVPTTANLGDYLDQLFSTTSSNALLPQRTLNNFFISLKQPGIEPSLPIIKYGTADANLIGMAVFQDDKLVGTIKQPHTRAILLLKENFIKGSIDLKVNSYMVSYYIQSVDSTIEPSYQNGQFTFDIDLKLEVDIIENTSYKRLIENKPALSNMERHLAAGIEKEVNHLFDELQKYSSDVLGIGQQVRANQPELFKPDEWPQEFSRANINTSVEVQVRRIGITT